MTAATFLSLLTGINFNSKDDCVTHVKEIMHTYVTIWTKFLEFGNLQGLADEGMKSSGFYGIKFKGRR
jgi:hypothetical protein